MAEQVQSGLDAVESPKEEITAVGGLAKPIAAKGPYALPAPQGSIGYDPALLEEMQKMITMREAQRNSFGERMKDAMAWWSGGVAGPAEPLAEREKTKQQQDAELFGMKAQLSQAKIGQKLNELTQASIFGSPVTAATQSGTLPPSHVAAGAPTESSTLIQQGGMLGLVRDAALRQSIAAQALRDPVGAQKAIQTYLEKNATDTDMIKDLRYMVANGLIDPKLVPAAALTKFAGAAAFVPHDVRGSTGTVQSTPIGSAGAMVGGGGGAPTAAPAVVPANRIAPAGTPQVAPAVTAPAVTAPAAKAPATTPAAGATIPAAGATTPAASVIKPPAQVTPPSSFKPPLQTESPVEAQIRAAGLDPTSKEANEMRQKAGETLIAGQGKQLEKTGEAAGDRLNKMRDLSERGMNTIPTAQAVIDIADNPKLSKVMGLAHGTQTVPTALTTAGDFIPGIGAEKVEKALVANYLSPEERVAYKTVQGASQKLGIDFAADVFKGARMGIGLEKMAMGAKGVGTEMPAEVNKRNAALIRDAAQFQQDKSKMWESWADSHGGKFADFNQFESSPEYIKFRDDAQQHFLNTYKGIVKPLGEEAGAHPAESLVEKYRTKKRQ